MDSQSVSLRLISLDPLCIAVAFLLLAVSTIVLARRMRSSLLGVSALAFGYCSVAEAMHFAFQFVDSKSFVLGSFLAQLWFSWPVVFLLGSVALAVALFRHTVVAPELFARANGRTAANRHGVD